MISEHIIRNTYYTICHNLGDSHSVNAAVYHFQVDPRCAKMFGSLTSGTAICRQTQATWNSAFLVKIDLLQEADDVTPVKYDIHDFVPSITEEQTRQIIEELCKEVCQKKEENSPVKQRQSELEKISLKLLGLWIDAPYTPVARLFERLGTSLHYTVQMKIREFIEQKMWAKFAEARIGRKTMLLMEVTEKGYGVLQKPMPQNNRGRGGITHCHYSQWIRDHYIGLRYKAYLEYIPDGTNHPVDVAVIYENHHIEVFEVCCSISDNLTSHVDVLEKNPNVKKLTVIAGTKAELAEIKKMIKSNLLLKRFQDRIYIDVIENYMERKEKCEL